MDWSLAETIDQLKLWIPSGVTLVVACISLVVIRRILFPIRDDRRFQLTRRITTIVAIFVFALALILSLPISHASRTELLSFFGILITATVALSSTTFIGNIMAGLMLKAMRNFRPGDFIKVDSHFGRVTETGLLRTEIQTEFRDLTTIPNLFLVTHPVRTIQECGTIVYADVSLGYDVKWNAAEEAMLRAAIQVGLDSPFVRVTALGDYSVSYRCCGFLDDTKTLLSSRSDLCKAMLDSLHAAGIEIVSPAFENQRQYATKDAFVPEIGPDPALAFEIGSPEERIFDKAERAKERVTVQKEIAEIEAAVSSIGDDNSLSDEEKNRRKAELEQKRAWLVQKLQSFDDDKR